MELIVEFFVETILYYLFSYPGTFIRWAFTGFKKGEFKTYIKQDIFLNSFVFLVFVGIITALYALFF